MLRAAYQQPLVPRDLRDLWPLDNEALVQQAKVNTTKQFAESPDFDDAVTGAVADNQGAHAKMADYLYTNAPGRPHLIYDVARWFHRVVASDTDNRPRDTTASSAKQ